MAGSINHLQGLQDWMQLRNYSKTTISSCSCALKQFLTWREEETYLGLFAMAEARQYILYRYKQGAKWQTVNGDYSAFYVITVG